MKVVDSVQCPIEIRNGIGAGMVSDNTDQNNQLTNKKSASFFQLFITLKYN